MGEAMQEFVFCIEKYGEYTFEGDHRARLIAESSSFDEMRALLAGFELLEDGVADEKTLGSLVHFIGADFPRLDRLLRWPWDEDYEPA